MTHVTNAWVARLALILVAAHLPASVRADEKAFERAHEVQQRGYAEYFKGLMSGQGRTPESDRALRQQTIEPAKAEGARELKNAANQAWREGFDKLKPIRDQFARLREAEKTGKKPAKAPASEQRQPAAKAAKQFENMQQPEAPPKPKEAIDGKGLQDVIDF